MISDCFVRCDCEMFKVRRNLSSFGVSVTSIYLVTFVIIMPFVGRDLLYSVYRSSSWTTKSLQVKAMMENKIQYESAVLYLKTRHRHRNIMNIGSRNDKISLNIVVVTVPRTLGQESLGYLTQTVARLDQLIYTNDVINHVRLSVCNVNAGPGPHRELETLRQLFRVVDRFPNGSSTAAILDPFEKEKEDYVFCMQEALDDEPQMILVVEDDAVARKDLFPVIRWTLAPGRTAKSWAFVKLFYPDRWQGYSVDLRTILELSSIFAIGGTLGVTLCLTVSTNRRFITRRHIQQFVVCGLYCVLLAVTVGRQHINNIKRLSPSLYSLAPAPACCTPAILYLSGFASELTRHLSNNVRCSNLFPLDMAIHAFAETSKSSKYLLEPNIFRHIGLVSSMKGYSNYPEEMLI